jgi:RNA polymerase sigma-70 factor, ECF subfamily
MGPCCTFGRMDDVESRIRALLAAGDYDTAVTVTLEAYGSGVLAYLCAMLGEDDARDAFSHFAEDLWRGFPSYRGECSARAWSYRLARFAAASLARDAYRVRRQRLRTSAASRLAARIVSSSTLAYDRHRERLARLRAALTPEERTLLVLRVDREFEWDEISAVLAGESAPVTSATLRKRFERLKSKLAELARAEGLVD